MKEIEDIIRFHDGLDWASEKMALGTVVHVEESSYRTIGARLYVTSSGKWLGGISGGCLEGDALKKAQLAIRKNKCSIAVYDTQDGDTHQIGVGLGCEGRIEVLFTPLNPKDGNNPIEKLRQVSKKRIPTILIHVLRWQGQKKEILGSMYTLDELGKFIEHTHLLEDQIKIPIDRVRQSQKSEVINITTKDLISSYDILIECLPPKIRLICIGSNYDIGALLYAAKTLSWEAIIVGNKSILSKEIYNLSTKVYSNEEVDKVELDGFSAIMLMAHDYDIDKRMLNYFATKKPFYLGLLGPKKRMSKMQIDLQISLESLPFLYAPAGLDIGATTPQEIAMSITSEIIAVSRNRNGGYLKNRMTPIHDR